MIETKEPALRLPSRIPGRLRERLDRGRELADRFEGELSSLKRDVDRLNDSTAADWGLQGFLAGFSGGVGTQDTQAMPYTLMNANAYYLITLNRILLSNSYVTQGLLRTVVDVPIEDSLRGGIAFKTSQLNDEELDQLNRYFRERKDQVSTAGTPMARLNVITGYDVSNSDLDAIKLTAKWGRLFGGSGLLVNTDQDFAQPLDVAAIREDSPLEFIPADRWELTLTNFDRFDPAMPTPFNYYGKNVERGRVFCLLGADAPSWIRMRLQGWGLSILEECIRPVNSFLKFERLLFELLDEAKTDVYKVKGFNSALMTPQGTALMTRRIALANQLKNYQTSIVMDVDDDYNQKQIAWSGFGEIWDRISGNLCAYLKFPRAKLFGESASGFSSGKDSADNYNSLVEIERGRTRPLLLAAGAIRAQQLFGFVPDDFDIEFESLQVLDGVEQEGILTSQQARVVGKYSVGLTTGREASEELRKLGLLDVKGKTEVEEGLRDAAPPPTANPDEAEAQREHETDLAKAKTRKPGPGERQK